MTGPWAGSKVLVTPRSVTAGAADEVASEPGVDPGVVPEVGTSTGSMVGSMVVVERLIVTPCLVPRRSPSGDPRQ